MAVTALNSQEPTNQKVILQHVSWETYERLLSEQDDSAGTRFNYDRGAMEIMIVSLKHEKLKHTLATLVEVLAEELGVDTVGAGSTTFRRRDMASGFEPAACFYFRHAARIRGQDAIDLTVDPAPELVIEIDVSHPSLNKLPIYAGLGVSEVWRYDSDNLVLLTRKDDDYIERAESAFLPGVTSDRLNDWIARSQQQDSIRWLAGVRRWIRAEKGRL